MSLTWKLILGFLFALVLQVSQMLISGYFTAKLQDATQQVSSALQANLAVQNSIDAVRLLQDRITEDLGKAGGEIDLSVYNVYVEEACKQAEQFAVALADTPNPAAGPVATQVAALTKGMQELEGHPRATLTDEVQFYEDTVRDLEQALLGAQLEIKALAIAGVELEREVSGLPVRAGLVITLCGVVLMAAFVAWFSRQLVIPIERAWAELEQRVASRTEQLATSVASLEEQITERKRVEGQKEELNRQLVDASRRAGMAELATGVLHNVGNVLNSVNTSSTLLLDGLRKSKVDGLKRALVLIGDHEDDLASFMTESAQGQMLPKYLGQLSDHLSKERDALVAEANDLSTRVTHMMEIVSRQQSYACVSNALTMMHLSAILDDVLSMHMASFADCDVSVERSFDFDEALPLDQSRVMQIFMNLIGNAKRAIKDTNRGSGTLRISLEQRGTDRIRARIADDGVGISAEGLTKIFNHGFTTKSDGHGFGLHHSANAATEMGGRLWAESDGVGLGATFLLELPLQPNLATNPPDASQPELAGAES